VIDPSFLVRPHDYLYCTPSSLYFPVAVDARTIPSSYVPDIHYSNKLGVNSTVPKFK
jgi:hypothetical protein